MPNLVINKQKIHVANEKAQHAFLKGLMFFFWWGLGGGGGFFPLSPMCSQEVPQVHEFFPKTFPITLQFYGIWFAQPSIFMYIN